MNAAAGEQAPFDFSEAAELYGGSSWKGRRRPLTYRRFDSAAQAISYVVEEIAGAGSTGCVLEVQGERYDYAAIRKLYDSSEFPLKRKTKGPPHAAQAKLPV